LILDTNALSATAERHPAALEAVAAAQDLAIPVIVLGEYRFGIAHSRRRKEYEHWLAGMMADSTILGIDQDTASHYAQIRIELKVSGKPIPPNDTWIAALCRQYAAPLLSRDRHFDFVPGLQRLAW